ncbi:MAG: hypothetical protein RIQ70_905 [Bacteroidota bacterium]
MASSTRKENLSLKRNTILFPISQKVWWLVGVSSDQFDKIVDINNKVIGTFEKKIILSNRVSGEVLQNGLVLITEDNFGYKFSEGLNNIENKFYDKSGKMKFNIPGIS